MAVQLSAPSSQVVVVPRLRCADLLMLSEKFRLDMKRRGLSPATVRIYRWAANDLIGFIGSSREFVDRDLLEAWQDQLDGHLHPRSAALARTGMHQLIQFAADRDLCDPRLERAIVGIKVERRQPRPLQPNDFIRLQAHLIEACDPVLAQHFGLPAPSLRDYRDRALFHYIVGTGGRVSEILQINRGTYEKQIIRQKGGTPKELAAATGVAYLIQQYLVRRTDDLPCLWIGWYGDNSAHPHPLTDEGVLRIWKKLAVRWHLPEFKTHTLRHTCATLLHKAGYDALLIASYLGHADTRSAHLYAKVGSSKLQAARADLDVAI